jgi:hypothetical protein
MPTLIIVGYERFLRENPSATRLVTPSRHQSTIAYKGRDARGAPAELEPPLRLLPPLGGLPAGPAAARANHHRPAGDAPRYGSPLTLGKAQPAISRRYSCSRIPGAGAGTPEPAQAQALDFDTRLTTSRDPDELRLSRTSMGPSAPRAKRRAPAATTRESISSCAATRVGRAGKSRTCARAHAQARSRSIAAHRTRSSRTWSW